MFAVVKILIWCELGLKPNTMYNNLNKVCTDLSPDVLANDTLHV